MPSRVIPRVPPQPCDRRQWLPRRSCGYTLVEIIAVISVIIILLALTASLTQRGPDAGKAAWDMAGFIEQARAYAVAQNTYVWVMFNQANASNATQKNTAVFAVASRNGTYSVADTNLIQVGKMMVFQNVSLANLSAETYAGDQPKSGVEQLCNRTFIATGGSNGFVKMKPIIDYTPNQVIRFNPEGSLEAPKGPGISTVEMFKWIEVGLQPMRGDQEGPREGTAVLQVAGLTGQVQVYRK